MAIRTHFVNNTTLDLASPFDDIRSDHSFHEYMSELAMQLMHYHPSIKQNIVVDINNDEVTITVTFAK